MSVNARLAEPSSPGPWVDDYECSTCGERYSNFIAGVTFAEAANLVRLHNPPSGGFRSRGPVLWAMRVIKLSQWYERHWFCQPQEEKDYEGNS